MRNAINHIGLMLVILFAAIIAAHLSAVDADSASACPASAVVRFEAFATGDTVAAVCEPGEFDVMPRNIRGTLLLVGEELIVIEQSEQKYWIRHDEVTSLYHVHE